MNDRFETVSSRLLCEQYTRIECKSGLTVYVFPKELSVSYALIGVKFGSIDKKYIDPKTNEEVEIPEGVAHFLEHKMFENEDGEDTFVKFSRTGANGNAYTSYSSTAYLFSCTENFYESLEILLRSTNEPYFTKENVKKEQGIIAQEIKMYDDDPADALFSGIMKCLYEKLSIRDDIAGTVSSVSKITPSILNECHQLFYDPSNMVLCVCGRVDTDRVHRIASDVFSESSPVSVQRIREKEAPEVFKTRSEKKMPVSKPLFCIGVKDTDISKSGYERMKKDIALQLLSSMLFGKSSDFYTGLIEKGLISPSLSCWTNHNEDFSFITVSGDSDSPEEVYLEFEKTAMNATEEINAEDFERCRRAMYSNYIKEFDSTEEIANSLVIDFALDGGDIFAYAELLKSITYEYVSAVARQVFRKEAFAMSKIIPVDTDKRKE